MRDRISRSEIGSSNPFDIIRKDVTSIDSLDVNDNIEVDNVSDDISPINVKNVTEDVVIDKITETSEEDKEVEDILPDSAKVKIKTNIPRLLAERLKSDGQLPEDFEVTEETTSTDIENAYRKYLADRIREEERNEALQQLREEGYDDSVLSTAKKLHYGVPEEEIKLEQVYTYLGAIEINDSEESHEKLTKTLFEQYYLDKGLSVDEAVKNSDRDYADSTEEEIRDLIEGRKQYFNNRAIKLDQDHKDAIKRAELKESEDKKENIKKINNLLDKKVLDGVNYTDEEMETVRKALFVKSEVLTLKDGKRIRVTPYYKKKYERSMNEEQALKDIADFILGYNTETLSDKIKKTARKELVDTLNDLIEVEVDIKNNKVARDNDTGSTITRREL